MAGLDHACRGDSPTDNAAGYYVVSPALDCKALPCRRQPLWRCVLARAAQVSGFCFEISPQSSKDPSVASRTTHLPKGDLLTFLFSHFGPPFVKVPKG